MTEVVNKRDRLYDVYIGRGSIWGNPFTHIPHGTKAEFVVHSRDEAIDKYEHYIRDKLQNNPEMWQELQKLEGKVLGCFCKPKRCHGDILVKILEEIKTVPLPPR